MPTETTSSDIQSHTDTTQARSFANQGFPKKVIAALLAFLLGPFGVHKFYLGYPKEGTIMLLTFVFGLILLGIPSIVIGTISFVEAILYLGRSNEEFEQVYLVDKRAWF